MRPFLVMLALAGMISAAQAQTDDRYPSWNNRMQGYQPKREWRWPHKSSLVRKSHPRRHGARRTKYRIHGAQRVAGRPAAWCGWWLGHYLGMLDRKLWLARNWASVGRPAHGPAVGVIVVWRHHVGIVTGKTDKGWIVKSGNDGHAVRERVRSVNGAIAYRVRA